MKEIDSWDNPNVKDRIVTKEMKKPKKPNTIRWLSEEEIRRKTINILDTHECNKLFKELFKEEYKMEKVNYEKAFEVAINFIKDKCLYEEYKKLRPTDLYEIKVSIKKKEDFAKLFDKSIKLFTETNATVTPLNDETINVIDDNTDWM